MAAYPSVDGLCVFSTYVGLSLRLNWLPVDGDYDGVTESVVDGISGYNVYRALQQLSPFTKLNSTPIQGLTYFHTPSASIAWRRNENVRNEYWFYVTAIGPFGEGDFGPPRTFKPYWAFDNSPCDGLCVGSLL